MKDLQRVVVLNGSGPNVHKDSVLTDLKAAEDIRQGRWLVDALDNSDNVCSIVPRGYECYARVLHPAWQHRLEDCHVVKRPVSWAEVALKRGRAVHRLMQWPHVSGLPRIEEHVIDRLAVAGCVILSAPDEGTIPLTVAAALRETLISHMEESDSCCFGIWNGYWSENEGVRSLGLGKPKAIGTQRREWFLFHGSLDNIEYSFAGADRHQSANLVWAEDRSWCLGVGVDLYSTYIGGSKSLISTVLASGGLEAYAALPEDNITFDADRVNPHEPYHRDLIVIRAD